jgi:N-acetylmuramoyl-L-alanine amidase
MPAKKLEPSAVEYLVVHCSATPPSQNIGVVELDRMHRQRGFLMVGYHRIIRRDGTVEDGRPLDMIGAHVEDYNHCSIGICMVGGVDKNLKPENNFEAAQFEALALLLDQLKLKFPTAKIQGHRDFPNVAKACPSFGVHEWLQSR